MSKFQFKLERVLDVRILEEEQSRERLLQARQKLKEIEAQLHLLQRERGRVYRFVRKHNDPSLQAREYLKRQQQKIIRVEMELRARQEVEEQERRQYFERRKERKILEELKEREYSQFQKKLFQREQKELDDLGQRCRGVSIR